MPPTHTCVKTSNPLSAITDSRPTSHLSPQAGAEASAIADAAKLRASDAEDALSNERVRTEQVMRIAALESAGVVAHFKEKWQAEFDRRKKLHNQVSEVQQVCVQGSGGDGGGHTQR